MTTHNTFKTVFLLTTLTVLLVLIGRLLGGMTGMIIAFGLAVVMNFGAYWFSDKLALSMSGAREIDYKKAPELFRLVERLALQAKLPMPRLYVMETPTPNAFATGRDPSHAAVAVTTGITQILTTDELAGVIAHELAHVKNRDTLISAVVATFAGAITSIAHMAQWAMVFGGFRGDNEDEGIGGMVGGLVMIIVAPIAAMLIQLAISRAREFDADATGARILGDSLPLARALEKLEATNRAVPMAVNPSIAHQFTVQPLSGRGIASLFSTHPPTSERIAKLRQLALQPLSYVR